MRRVLFSLILMSFVVGLPVSGARVEGAGTNLQIRWGASRAAAQSVVRFVPRSIRSANRRLRYTIKARYPQAVGVQRDQRLNRLNQELRTLITKSVGSFSEDFQAPEERMGTMGSSYDANYWVSLSTTNLISLTFGVSTYYEGAAHPNHHTIAFNYDLKTGRTLALKDLFKPGSAYMKVISDYAIEALKRKLGEDADQEWIQKGAGPDEENYKSWNITKTGLVVTFDPYQVIYYAAGPQEITIPFSVLRNVIDPNGPLTGMIR